MMLRLRPPPALTLINGLFVTPNRVFTGGLRIERGMIAAMGAHVSARRRDIVMDLDGACVYPGLINAHDHLDLDLLPRVGRGPYPNSYAWFDDVNRQREALDRILDIPAEDRLRWGGFRNLFSGVTTVAHHNPYHRRVFDRGFPVRVLRRYRWSHSLRLAGTYGGRPEEECAKARENEPFIIHIAEGVDEVAAQELSRLDRLGALTPHTVLVHGVGLTAHDHALLRKRRASLVWCPSSNLFLFNRTADIPALLGEIPIALGTDSTLSGLPTLFDELRTADRLGYADTEVLVRMVTSVPAAVLGLIARAGRLAETLPADILVLYRMEDDPFRNLITATPARVKLILIDGMPRFGDTAFATLFESCRTPCDTMTVDGAVKLVAGGCGALIGRLRETVGDGLPIRVETDRETPG